MTISAARVPERREVTARSGRHVVSPREDLVTAVLGTWLIGGLLADAWAHTNIVDTIESFFTPWHALLYTGFAAVAAWTFWLAARRRPRTARWWRDGWPAGYALGAAGAVGFTVGGLLDMVWHSVFGVETSLDIAFSPSHLLLSFSGVLLLTSPVRSWWAAGDGGLRTVAAMLAITLGTVFGSILLTSLSAFYSAAPTRQYDHVPGSASERDALLGLASYLITTMVLVVPLLLVHRRRATPGMATMLVAVPGLFMCLMLELPPAQTAAAVGAIAGAALADVALLRLDALRGADAVLRLPVAGAVFALLVWTGHLVGLHLAAGLHWPAELIGGAVVFAAAIAAVLGCLAHPPRPEPAPTPATRPAG